MPRQKKVEEARKVMNDVNVKWEPGKKEKAQVKFTLMEGEYTDFILFYNEVERLAEQHELLVTDLATMYSSWYNNVSSNGEQPTEMMNMQAKELENIFGKLYEALKPLELDLKPPKNLRDE